MKSRFLLDEHVDVAIQRQLRRMNKLIEVLRVGDVGTLKAGTDDPDILNWAGQNGFIIVTEDRSTMPDHVSAHMESGKHFSGLFWLRPDVTIGQIVEELHLIWQTCEAEEFIDHALFIPL
jgi:predicted nuclease of predicted toxin-antitoxin system